MGKGGGIDKEANVVFVLPSVHLALVYTEVSVHNYARQDKCNTTV